MTNEPAGPLTMEEEAAVRARMRDPGFFGPWWSLDVPPLLASLDASRERTRELEEALRGLLEVCSCSNGCAPSDMTCATSRARTALAGVPR